MAGALTHIGIGLISALIVYLIWKKAEFSYSIFVGNLLPDVLKFGISALKQGTLALTQIQKDGFYQALSALTSNINSWLSLGFFIFAVLLFLYHFHYIKKKKLEEYSELYGFLLAGIITHLIIDAFVQEQNIWF